MTCTVYYNDTSKQPSPNKMSFFEELYFDYKVVEENGGERLSLFVHPKQTISLSKVVIEIPYTFKLQDRLFCNGFQSWSQSKTYTIDQKIPRLRKIAKRYFQYYGDEHLFSDNRPDLYSWTYGYIQNANQYYLIGSTQENTAFSLIEYDTNANIIRITKLCDDISLSHSFPVFDILLQKGTEQKVFDGYFQAIGKSPKKMLSTFGWTSWYRHYNKISESKILKDLESFSAHTNRAPFNETERIFQIDDGYQSAIGDWLSTTNEFPGGMSKIANKIKEKNLVPGIWIAPFVCSAQSKIFASHKDWLLRDKNDKPIRAGYNPHWGGWYYALDIYNKQLKDYLTEVFFTFLNKWGYQLIKADFLFAACIAPPKDKTKGQVMHEAMTFLEQLIGQHRLLACGVPLGSTFNRVAYCRIGPDTHLAWEHHLLHFLRKRERVSTIAALRSIIHRRHLDKRVFINDPDVFIMRKDGHKLSNNQQFTILLVQILFGNQFFNSDDWSQYDEDTIDEIAGLMEYRDAQILSCLEYSTDYYHVVFKKKVNFIAHINLTKSKVSIPNLRNSYTLEAYESIVLKK